MSVYVVPEWMYVCMQTYVYAWLRVCQYVNQSPCMCAYMCGTERMCVALLRPVCMYAYICNHVCVSVCVVRVPSVGVYCAVVCVIGVNT